MQTQTLPVGEQLRAWRSRRRLSQLDLALEAEISARHLSFLETGRSRPSRGMLLRLADRLAIPARDRNLLLVAAGFAPALPERSLDDPALAAARRAVELVLKAHEPFPALRRRPALAARRRQCGRRTVHGRRRAASARAAGQRAAAQPSPGGPGAAHRESGRNGAPISCTGWRRRSRRAAIRCWRICWRSCAPIRAGRHRAATTMAASRCRCGSSRGGDPVLPQHDDHVRHADRRHADGAGDRGFPAGGRGDGGGLAREGLKKIRAGGATGKAPSPPREWNHVDAS